MGKKAWNHRFGVSLPTFRVTWVKAGTSSVFGLESLRELRVQGAVGIGKGVGPSLTHGGRKVVLCGGWPPAPGILSQRPQLMRKIPRCCFLWQLLLHPRRSSSRCWRIVAFVRVNWWLLGTVSATILSDDDPAVRDAPLTDSWTDRVSSGKGTTRRRRFGATHFSREMMMGVLGMIEF